MQEGTGTHKPGQRLHFSFDPKSLRRHFLLFNLAGTGELQFLYPLRSHQDPEALLEGHDGGTPPAAAELLVKLGQDCQLGRLAYASGG